MTIGKENTMKTRFNPLDGKLNKPGESTPSTVEKKFNPLEGTVEEFQIAPEKTEAEIIPEKTEAEIKAEKAEQRRKIAEAEYEKQKLVTTQTQKTEDSYPPPEATLNKENQKSQNKTSFRPLDTGNKEPFDILAVDQTPKKKSFWKRLFS